MNSLTVRDLLLAYNDGSRQAYEELMKRSLVFVRRKMHTNRIKCYNQKEELVMLVVLKILNKMHTFIPNENASEMGFWSWVSTICFNTYMDFFRDQKKSSGIMSIDETYDNGKLKHEPSNEESWLKNILKKDNLADLARLANQLPEKQYLIIKLKYWFDMTNAEIASYVGETENNVRVLHHRALNKLQCLLKQKKHHLIAA